MAVETKSIIDDKEIKAKSLTIFEFLEDNNCINIPRYQREYSWKKENIKTLLNDIHKDYYLGNIISYKDSNVSEIIDGQQRIITTFLILITIRNITTNANLKNDIEKIIYHNDECKLKLKDRIITDKLNMTSYDVSVYDYSMTIYFEKEENMELINKEIELLKSNIERRNKLLSNTSYVNKAPEKLVNEERTKLELEKNKLEELLKKCK